MQQFKGINIQKRKIISLKKLGNSFFTFLHKDNTNIFETKYLHQSFQYFTCSSTHWSTFIQRHKPVSSENFGSTFVYERS